MGSLLFHFLKLFCCFCLSWNCWFGVWINSWEGIFFIFICLFLELYWSPLRLNIMFEPICILISDFRSYIITSFSFTIFSSFSLRIIKLVIPICSRLCWFSFRTIIKNLLSFLIKCLQTFCSFSFFFSFFLLSFSQRFFIIILLFLHKSHFIISPSLLFWKWNNQFICHFLKFLLKLRLFKKINIWVKQILFYFFNFVLSFFIKFFFRSVSDFWIRKDW